MKVRKLTANLCQSFVLRQNHSFKAVDLGGLPLQILVFARKHFMKVRKLTANFCQAFVLRQNHCFETVDLRTKAS